MNFEYRLICEALEGAEIDFNVNDICNVVMDADQISFTITGCPDSYFVRMWDMRDWEDKVVVEYSLYKANLMSGADLVFDSLFISEK